MKPMPDNSIEWYELVDHEWALIRTDPAPALSSHEHSTLGDINFTGDISANGDKGLTGERTLAGYTLTFKKGLLVGFSAP